MTRDEKDAGMLRLTKKAAAKNERERKEESGGVEDKD